MPKRSYFEGWYFKQQTENETLALIPAFHMDRNGRKYASLQVVTPQQAYYFTFPQEKFYKAKNKLEIHVEDNIFSLERIRLALCTDSLVLTGSLTFHQKIIPQKDIMGPFRFVPFIKCRHSLFCLTNQIEGHLHLNGKFLDFTKGLGYIEGDRGVSFPRSYLWTQCGWAEEPSVCVMLSAAEVPFLKTEFPGCICSILLKGKEYRIATYYGAKIISMSPEQVILRQGEYSVQAELLDQKPLLLRAPQLGDMTRTVRESPVCTVRYLFQKGEQVLLDRICSQASFEYVAE